jgi:hypothetical protein
VHGACDTKDYWYSIGQTYDSTSNVLTFMYADKQKLVLTQKLLYPLDEQSDIPEDKRFIKGSIVFLEMEGVIKSGDGVSEDLVFSTYKTTTAIGTENSGLTMIYDDVQKNVAKKEIDPSAYHISFPQYRLEDKTKTGTDVEWKIKRNTYCDRKSCGFIGAT